GEDDAEFGKAQRHGAEAVTQRRGTIREGWRCAWPPHQSLHLRRDDATSAIEIDLLAPVKGNEDVQRPRQDRVRRQRPHPHPLTSPPARKPAAPARARSGHSAAPRSRSELPTTLSELRLIAALAQMGMCVASTPKSR